MPHSLELLLLITGLLLLLSVLTSKISDRFGIPALLLFLVLGMLAGSEGIGGIYFDEPWIAKSLGIVALIFILFAGGLQTKLKDIKPVIWEGVTLSTLGVLLTALFVACVIKFVFGFSFLEGMLIGAIISSTDVASVLSILRSRNVHLKKKVGALLELESGSNDPMSVFLTLGVIQLMTVKDYSVTALIGSFFIQIVVSVAISFLIARLSLMIINRVQLAYEGLYPVLTIGITILSYSLTALFEGNGFLAVYLTALMLGDHDFIHKRTLIRFHEGIAWLMQVIMFLALGLLVFPSKIPSVLGIGLVMSLFLMFIARPLSVWICLFFSKIGRNEKIMISWVGLRGAVPIILATFPMIAGIPHADMIFNITFFIVLTSILFQGTSIPMMSRWLKVLEPVTPRRLPLELERVEGIDADLEEIIVPYNAEAVGKKIFEIGIPPDCLVVLLCRDGKFFIPSGTTILQEGDVLQVLGQPAAIKEFQQKLNLPS
jgi:cell volume regulation protein A